MENYFYIQFFLDVKVIVQVNAYDSGYFLVGEAQWFELSTKQIW